MKFMSYNSASNISNYTVGAAYAFYVNNNNVGQLTNADQETVRKYTSAIAEIINTNRECVTANGRWLAFTRVFGVVVDKHEASGNHDIDRITVMFKTTNGNYVFRDYAVGIHDVFTNGKDIVPPTVVLDL